jgi:peroxiredoxin
VLWAISTGNLAGKRAFCNRYGFAHRLLSDPAGAAARDYLVAIPVPGFPVANRVTVIIDPKGTVASVDPSVDFNRAAQTALTELDRLQAGVK